MAAGTKLVRVHHLDFGGIAGEFRIGADELEAAGLADSAAAAVAADEPAPAKGLASGANDNSFIRLFEALDTERA